MFKFDHQLALTHQPLGSGHESSVYAYLEGDDDTKWVVKCIKVDDPDRINTLLQNILITTSTNSGSVVPIKGYDLHRDRQGNTTAYLIMPRMQQSLKDLIQNYRADQQIGIPLHQIVYCFHSIASCLDELAQKEIAHRNLKPSNVLIDRDGHVYLSDIKMVEDKAKEMETRDEDSIYKAPETFYGDWAKNGEDLHKADAWGMGMVITRACLIDSLIPISPELPMEDNRNIIEQNLTMIADRYGVHLAEIVRGLLALNPRERETFSTIRMLLEEAFPDFMVGWPKDDVREIVGRQENKIIDIRDDSSKFHEESKEESIILDDSLRMGRQIDNSLLLWRGSQGSNPPKWIEFRRPEWFKPEWLQFRRPEWLSRHGLNQGLQKGKQLAKHYGVAILVSLVSLLLVLISLQSNNIAKEDKFVEIMTGIQIKHSNYFKIDFDRTGTLDIEAIPSNSYTTYFDSQIGQYVTNTLNDEILTKLMNDVMAQLASAHLMNHIKEFKFIFLPNCQITDEGIAHLDLALIRMEKLKRLTIEQINGPLTNYALRNLFIDLSAEVKDLRNIGINLASNRLMPEGHTYNLVATVLGSFNKLIGFSFSLDDTTLSDDELQQIAYYISDNGQNLEVLNIRLRGFSNTNISPRISDLGLQKFNSIFLSGLENLKELVLDFTGSPMADEALEMLAQGVNSQGGKLRRFELTIDNCELVTNAGLKYFGYQLSRKKLKNLDYLAIQAFQTSSDRISDDTRDWLRNQLQYIPEVHITPE